MDLKQEYDNLYAAWYMNDWPEWKKKRVKKIIKKLKLPQKGKALDFGCGSGVFTRLIKEALPEWEVFGTDLSDVALSLAKKLSDNVVYLTDEEIGKNKYDFIFSHHVLEHVNNINEILDILRKLADQNCTMLHIMPCGNKGSLDYFLASNRINGINKEKGNTFFYEEELHLNRFRSDQLKDLFHQFEFCPGNAYFSNHFLGCFSEMIGMNIQHIMKVTDPNLAISKRSARWFKVIRLFAKIFYYIQRPYTYFLLRSKNKAWTGPLLRHPEISQNGKITFVEILFFPSYVGVLLMRLMERIDWFFQKKNSKGSEMYLVIHKSNSKACNITF